jgi:uncharacterized protein YunC (DUF1805 family)
VSAFLVLPDVMGLTFLGVGTYLDKESSGGGNPMIAMKPIEVDGHTVLGIEVALPKTTLLVITTEKGYIMCGALDVGLLNERLREREIIAARAEGVRTLEQLMNAPLTMVTHTAEEHGIRAGMTGREALLKMI